MEGNTFISWATQELLHLEVEADVTPALTRSLKGTPQAQNRQRQVMKRPKLFDHYVLNLPASALSFVKSFKGIYKGYEELFEPHTEVRLPLVHVYCFSKHSEDEAAEQEICKEISSQLNYEMTPAPSAGNSNDAVSVYDVRNVAPHKRMFCATFRIPAKVAFART